MDLNDHEPAVIAAILAAVSALVSWHAICVRLAMLGGRGRGRGNGIVMNLRSNWDGARNVALRRLYEVSEAICHFELRMGRSLFHLLCCRLKGFGLRDSRHLVVEEQVAMFLWTVGHNMRNRNSVLHFYRSGHTVSTYFHVVLEVVIKLYNQNVRNATMENSPMADCSTQYPWHTYFTDVVGAVDGTHFEVKVPLCDQSRYHNRKGVVSQNVLVACTLDMRFTYVLVGWEGLAHDGKLLRSAVNRVGHKLTVPQGKYYLADAGFALVLGFLTPYRSVRYHLNEQGNPASNANELYNYRHSSLRTVVERAIGVLKMRFAYLRHRPFHDVKTHGKIILACCGLHNWLKEVSPEDVFFDYEEEIDVEPHLPDPDPEPNQHLGMAANPAWSNHRDAMRDQMWNER